MSSQTSCAALVWGLRGAVKIKNSKIWKKIPDGGGVTDSRLKFQNPEQMGDHYINLSYNFNSPGTRVDSFKTYIPSSYAKI